ncbi:hypothetical protein GRZ55_11300 [Chelativorans sp. ZYF759]|uniref:hypothetical protein n=1 Tax=Chelativorans sp. ZYF759 TaxID=2692213 RepID=UPI00145F2819|nr:hypothetical protein [Chelativorans sp. ZYF759]NMG39830.1 hypothetical protein [Chelativorans sp. ZYF759]
MTAFGVIPRPRGPRIPDRFGQAFPDPARLEALPDAMRHEAGLLAREAGLAVPPGALRGKAPQPHALVQESFAGAAPMKTARQLLDEFVTAHVVAAPGAWLPIENVQAALYIFCHDQGETTPSDRALLSTLIRHFGTPSRPSKGAINGFGDIALSGGKS